MKNKEKLAYLRDYAMELSAYAAGLEDARIVKRGEGPAPAQPKRKEAAAFADGVCIASAAIAALIDTGLPVSDGKGPEALLAKLVAHWVETRGV